MLYLINVDILHFIYGSHVKTELKRRKNGSRKTSEKTRVRTEEGMTRI